MMGHDMADQMCYEQAKAMGLAPNYRAFMSSHKQDLIHVVYPAFRDSLPVTNLRVRGLSMLKHLIKPECFVLNGYFPSGRCDVQELAVHIQRQRRASLRVDNKHCETWQADDFSVMGQSSSLTSGLLLGQQTRSCSTEYIVLCIETYKNS
ncbi:hypothetical protein XENOCAPTIV_002026 [Xenoophorus captivus]|uniref:Collagenase NC10/endostatin domain-containing protein n=1 Tax=Xenoophorus captivus TaxID=1517983 RepID=A0ABV0RN85_9TELE